jgi:hypothetical protein
MVGGNNMKYEFHVGDYVETKTGTIGYVSKVPEKGCPFWTTTKLSNYDIDNNRYTVEVPYRIFSFERFNRIGQYDFIKKDEGKIEPLIGKQANDYCNNELMWNKINEIIEAVNRLEEKVNGMA